MLVGMQYHSAHASSHLRRISPIKPTVSTETSHPVKFRVNVYGPMRFATPSGCPHWTSYDLCQQNALSVHADDTPYTQFGPCAMRNEAR
eukprot:m.52817 g.52817  ORF g.52817 m.52817 type:complete len:89 (-) comp16583_c0_seq1:1399-1665(-)